LLRHNKSLQILVTFVMMKQLHKIILLVLSLSILSCDDDSEKKGNLFDYIPQDASFITKVSNLESFLADAKNSSIINKLEQPNPYTFFSEENAIFKHLRPTSPSIIAFSNETDTSAVFTIITKETAGLFVTDSIPNKTVETLAYDDIAFQRVTIDTDIAFMVRIDSVFIASTSQKSLQDIIKQPVQDNKTLLRVYSIKENADVDVIAKNNKVSMQDSTLANFASWTSLDMTILPDEIRGTGVALARDTVSQVLNVFKGQKPQPNELAKVIPTDALGATIITFNDAARLQNEISTFNNKANNTSKTGIFESVSELGHISLQKGAAIAMRSIDPELTNESLGPFITETTSFRDVTIYNFSEPALFSESFYPLLPQIEAAYALQLDTFFVFTSSEEIANQIIIAYKNNDCLINTSYFKEANTALSSASSLVYYAMNEKLPSPMQSFFPSGSSYDQNKLLLKGFPLAVLQYTYDRDFAHVNFLCKGVSTNKSATAGVSETLNLKLDTEILGAPQFFSNHRNNGQDIVLQDITNNLSLYASTGKKLWSKKLDSPILGKINEVDLLRNGKKQMSFTTKNTFYVLDRNGNDVSPFPIKFKDEITMPLSVFDYDNNRKYRFIVTQGNEVFMYNSEGKSVNGFTFNKTKSTIVQSPQHIRLGNKDYIIIPEENGKLNILSRTGKSRISVSKDFSFSEIPLTTEDRDFVVIDNNDVKHSISQSGKVSSQKLEVSNSYWFTTLGNLKVTLDDNLLRINGKLIELPFGIYTRPQLFIANNTTYISVTETQEKKVNVYTKNGELVEGFPVYGSTSGTVINSSKKPQLLLLTTGGTKEVLLYTLN